MTYPRFILAALLSVSLAAPALARSAAPACYSAEQAQAEQLLRLHSELMVIAVTCRTGSDNGNLGTEYGDFTQRHLSALHEAEQTMMGYYKASVKGNATDRLDRLRTILANEFGQKAADMSSASFCASYRDKIAKLENVSGGELQDEVQRMTISERTYAPTCGTGSTTVARR
jgi:hypothetical protein